MRLFGLNLFGDILPFLGWREYPEDIVEMLANYGALLPDGREVKMDHRYSGFQFEWWFFHLGWGVKELGPREYAQDV